MFFLGALLFLFGGRVFFGVAGVVEGAQAGGRHAHVERLRVRGGGGGLGGWG